MNINETSRLDPTVECATPAPASAFDPSRELVGVSKPERDVSYIENAPERAVVLSRRLRALIGQVGGCQTDAVESLVKRILYEVFKK